jgi:hypothetical protein
MAELFLIQRTCVGMFVHSQNSGRAMREKVDGHGGELGLGARSWKPACGNLEFWESGARGLWRGTSSLELGACSKELRGGSLELRAWSKEPEAKNLELEPAAGNLESQCVA